MGRGYLYAHVFANLRQESERGVSQPHETVRCDPLGVGMGLVDMRLEHGGQREDTARGDGSLTYKSTIKPSIIDLRVVEA